MKTVIMRMAEKGVFQPGNSVRLSYTVQFQVVFYEKVTSQPILTVKLSYIYMDLYSQQT